MKRAECPLIIDKNNLRTLNIDDHIQFMITVHVHKCECHRNEITGTRIKLRSKKNAGMSSIPAGKLNHLYSSVEIYSNKVTGHACSFVMTHKLVRLKCPRMAIADVIHRSTEPVRGSHSHCPQDQHTQHSQTKIEQRMSTSFHCLLGFRQALCSYWLLWSCFGPRRCTGSSVLGSSLCIRGSIVRFPLPLVNLNLGICRTCTRCSLNWRNGRTGRGLPRFPPFISYRTMT